MLALAFAILLGAAACGSDSNDDASSSTTEAGSGASAFPVTIEHKYGETVVESKPERVVSVGYQDQDPLLALGIVPVGDPRLVRRPAVGHLALGPGAPGRRRARSPPSAEINFEQVALLKPDLIVGVSSGMTADRVRPALEFAPTITADRDQPDYQETWQTQTRHRRGRRRDAKAEELITEVEGRLRGRGRANPELQARRAP